MIKIVNGDLLEADVDILGHQVNCQGVMGSGIAAQIKAMYPEVFENYKNLCKAAQKTKTPILGECLIVEAHNGRYVANLFGQDKYGAGKVFTDYEALERSLTELKNRAKQYEETVGLPYKIGCARGGGDWDTVYNIIYKVFEDYEVTLYKI